MGDLLVTPSGQQDAVYQVRNGSSIVLLVLVVPFGRYLIWEIAGGKYVGYTGMVSIVRVPWAWLREGYSP